MATQQELINAANDVLTFLAADGFRFDSSAAMNKYQTPRAFVPDTSGIVARFADVTATLRRKAEKGITPSVQEATAAINAYARAFAATLTTFVNLQTAAIRSGEARIVPLGAWLNDDRSAFLDRLRTFAQANVNDPAFADTAKAINVMADATALEASNTKRVAEMKATAEREAAERARIAREERDRARAAEEAARTEEERRRAAAAAAQAERDAARAAAAANQAAEEAARAANEAQRRDDAAPMPVTRPEPIVATGSSTSGGGGKMLLIALAVVGVGAFLYNRSRKG